jgi:aquaporin Z
VDKSVKPVLAEFIGTFSFVFIGAGAICLDTRLGECSYGLLGIALAHGVMLSVMITALGHITGAHFNPAVTIATCLTRRTAPLMAGQYVFAQLVGGVAAGFVIRFIFPNAAAAAIRLGTPQLGTDIDALTGILIEAILTFFLVTVIFATAIDPKGAFDKVAGFGIGLTVFCAILVGGPLTGAAMNPARHFATAFAAGYWTEVYVYWVGPIAGAVIAGLVYATVFLKEDS